MFDCHNLGQLFHLNDEAVMIVNRSVIEFLPFLNYVKGQ